MKKKLFTLCAACLMAFTFTSCDGQEVTPEVAQAKLEAAEEAATDYRGATFSLKSSLAFSMNVSATYGEETSTVGLDLNSKTNESAGFLLNEDKTALEDAYLNGSEDITLKAELFGENASTSMSDSVNYDYNHDNNQLEGTSSSTTDGETTTDNTPIDVASFESSVSSSFLYGDFSAEASFSLKQVLANLTAEFGEPTYYTSFGNYSAKFEITTDSMFAVSGVEEDTDGMSITDEDLIAAFKIKDSYIKFTFNEKATKIAIEAKINVTSKYSASGDGYSASEDLSLKYSLKTNIDLVNSL